MLETIAAIVTGAAAIAASVTAWVRHRRREQPRKAIRDQSEIYDILARLVYKLAAVRCVVVRTHNGGGVPNAKTPIYTSALQESQAAAPLKGYWQNLPVDKEYIGVLDRLIQEGAVRIEDTEALEGGSTLKTIYEADSKRQIQTEELRYLMNDSHAVFYLSVQWAEPSRKLRAIERMALTQAVNEIKNILSSA